MPTLAITGLANTGKSSLFGALTGQQQGIASFPFTTTETRVGRLEIEDPLLGQLGRLEGSARVTPAGLEVLDTPARNRLGGVTDTETIGRIRQSDCLLVVVRAFADPAVAAPGTVGEPNEQIADTMVDLAINDAQVFEGALPRLRNQATSRPERRSAAQTVARALEVTKEGNLLRTEPWTEEQLTALADFAPLTLKPTVWVVNVGEDRVGTSLHPPLAAVPAGDPILTLSLALEAEAAALVAFDRVEMREAFGMGEGAAQKVSRASMQALGLCTFFTANRRETRAWLAPRGCNARQAAGRVHSDMERGFIRAEVAEAANVIEAGGWDSARRKGVTRVEGRDYPVQTNDVVQIRFSV